MRSLVRELVREELSHSDLGLLPDIGSLPDIGPVRAIAVSPAMAPPPGPVPRLAPAIRIALPDWLTEPAHSAKPLLDAP